MTFGVLLAAGVLGHQHAPSHALILIRSDRVGRAVSADSLQHRLWARWPGSEPSPFRFAPSRQHETLSLLTGVDWSLPQQALTFRPSSDGRTMVPSNRAALEAAGYANGLRATVGETDIYFMKRPDGAMSTEGLAAAIGFDLNARVLTYRGTAPANSIVVYDAASWDDAADIADWIGGRAIKLQYPAEQGRSWSTFWLSGRMWPAGVPVHPRRSIQGLLRASELGKLLTDPESFAWVDARRTSADTPNKWLRFGQGFVRSHIPYVTSLVIVLAWTTFLISRERRSTAALISIALLSLAIPSSVVAGNMARSWGLHGWVWWMCVSYLFLAVAAVGLYAMFRRLPGSHPLLGLAVAVALPLLTLDANWSPLSGELSDWPRSASPEALGLLFLAFASCIAFARVGSIKVAIAGFVCAAGIAAYGLVANPWWSRAEGWLPVFAAVILAAAGLTRLSAIVTVAMAGADIIGAGGAITWAPYEQYSSFDGLSAINVADHARFIPALGLAAVISVGLLYRDRFVRRQLKSLYRSDPRRLALPYSAAIMLAYGLVEPFWLHAGLVAAIGAVTAILFDAVHSL